MALGTLAVKAPSLASILKSDAVAIGFCKSESGEFTFPVARTLVNQSQKFWDLSFVDELEFFGATGKAGEIFEIPVSADGAHCERVFLVGLGDESLGDCRIAGAALGRKVRGKAISLFSIAATSRAHLRGHAIALALATYQWSNKSEITKASHPKFFLVNTFPDEIEAAKSLVKALWWTRDMIHTPANIKTPAWMASQARTMAKKSGIAIKVLAGKELEGFGGLNAVGNSSPKPGPRFIQASYAPAGSKKWPHVVLVGKGITFDTGGVSLKRPYDTMVAMKSDMAGAAAVLAVVNAMPEFAPKVRVTALLMCAENALSGTAQRPSDVITQYDGTTVEIINTDAEGRLVLADGLAYANEHLEPDYLVDVATLTGAATLGLGRQYAAMFTRDSALAKKLHGLGNISGDQVWHMPLIDDYKIALKSSIADLNHTADKPKFSAGSVTAALFLEHFAGERNWVHLDIAGTVRSESDSGENQKGGTGFGVRLLIDWIVGMK